MGFFACLLTTKTCLGMPIETNYNGSRISTRIGALRRLFWTTLKSLTAVWVRYCMMNFTDSTSHTGCFSRWQWLHRCLWTAAHHRTSQTNASRPPVPWRHLPSANCRQLLAVPRYRLNTYGRRAFSVAGPTVWNSLPDFIRDPTISADCFIRSLKTYLFTRY